MRLGLNVARHIRPPRPPAGWLPTPPVSYPSTSGTIAYLQLESAVEGSGPGIGQQTFHPNQNRVVQTPDGTIFVAYNYHDETDHTITYHRVKTSTDGGSTFGTIYDSQTQGDPTYGNPPAVEMDSSGNVYVIQMFYPRTADPKSTRIRKWAAGSYTGTGTQIATYSTASQKYAVFLDQGRSWIWVCFWSAFEPSSNQLVAFDLSGNVVKQQTVFTTYVTVPPESYGAATYPYLYVNTAGRLFLGWTAESSGILGTQSYYDSGFIYSDDAAATFQGPNGQITLPVWCDGSGTSAKTPWLFGHNGVDRLVGSDPNYGNGAGLQYNWDHMSQFIYNQGKLHGMYGTESGSSFVFGPTSHHPYFRFDLGSGTVDYRKEPAFDSDDGTSYHSQTSFPCSFAQDTTMAANRIYFCTAGTASQSHAGNIAVFYCNNPAAATPTWLKYADVATGQASFINSCVCRYVNTDGSLVGIVQGSSAGFPIYFYKVTPT